MHSLKNLLLISLLFLQIKVFAQNTGEIQGVVMDKESNIPLAFASVKIYYNGDIIGDVTDINGVFNIKYIVADTYDLKISYIGKKNLIIKNIKVDSTKITFLDTAYLNDLKIISCGGCFYTICFKYYGLFDEEPSKIELRPEELTIPGTYVLSIPSRIARIAGINRKCFGSVSVSSEQIIHIRGSRASSTTIYLDGIKINVNTQKIPFNLIKSIYYYEGGLPAKYGDTKSGVTIIETKSYFELLNQRKSMLIYD